MSLHYIYRLSCLLLLGVGPFWAQAQSLVQAVRLIDQEIHPDSTHTADSSVLVAYQFIPASAANDSMVNVIDTLPPLPPASLDAVGLLAAYAYRSKTKAVAHSHSFADIMDSYRHNPYLATLLNDAATRATLEANYDPIAVQATIDRVRSGPREGILKTLSDADVYADNKMFQPLDLLADYQQPGIDNQKAVTAAAQSAQLSSVDPAAFAATFLSGLADWIAERAQAELVQTFLLRLQQNLSEKQLNVLFPQTYQYLAKLEVANYRAIIANARLAFAQDLNALSLNLSNYLYASGKIDEANSAAYNLLLVFRLVDLAQKELPFTDILAYANGEFSRRRFESEKALHARIIAQPDTAVYDSLRTAFRVANKNLLDTYLSLSLLQDSISQRFTQLGGAAAQAQYITLYDDAARLEASLQHFNYAGLFQDAQNNFLTEVNDFLAGQVDYATLVAYPSLDGYRHTFLTNPPTAAQLKGVGLTMIRELLRQEDGEYPIFRELKNYFFDLKRLDAKITSLEDLLTASPTSVTVAATTQLTQLLGTFDTEENYWKNQGATEREWRAIEYLKNLLTQQLVVLNNAGTPAALRDSVAHANLVLQGEIKELFIEQVNGLARRYPDLASPYLAAQVVPVAYADIEAALQIDSLALRTLDAAFVKAETTPSARPLYAAYANATLFGDILEAGTQLLYCLAIDVPGSKTVGWATPRDLAAVMNDDTQRQFFLGLLYQRISSLTESWQVDSRGLADIANQVVQQLAQFPANAEATSPLVAKIQFASSLINGILETPLVLTDSRDSLLSVVKLVENRSNFGRDISQVPRVNENLTELFLHIQQKGYRYALENVIELIEIFAAYPDNFRFRNWKEQRLRNQLRSDSLKIVLAARPTHADALQKQLVDLRQQNQRLDKRITRYIERQSDTKKAKEKKRFRNDLFRYGHFIADIAGSDSAAQVQAAIENIALPVGSSQNKRLQPWSAELNAYFGGTGGKEHILNVDELGDPNLNNEKAFNSFSLFVPVGLSLSRRLGRRHNYSLSLFLPIIDLGALTTYRLDNDNPALAVLPDFTFANVLAPGAHVFLNFPKSPFFIGVGAQYGPNVREYQVGDMVQQVRAVRYLFSFGIDVPVLSFTKN